MSAPGPPSKPPGPPPARPPPDTARSNGATVVRGVGEIKSAPGPPPGAPPMAVLKPPPLAPPPRSLLQQNAQRPAFENIRAIETPRGPPPRGLPQSPQVSMSATSPARGMPPPRALYTDFQPSATSPAMARSDGTAPSKTDGTPEKTTMGRKAGAISMFEGNGDPPPQEPAEKKTKPSATDSPAVMQGTSKGPRPGPPPPRPAGGDPQMQRIPRPLPPQPQPPGIPEGQPMPPDHKPDSETKAPPPVKPAPNRNRAPPREEPGVPKVVPNPAAPDSEAPFPRGKKPKVEVVEILKRREREMPEFESSSSEEENQADFKTRMVKQPAGKPRTEVEDILPKPDEDDAAMILAPPPNQLQKGASSQSSVKQAVVPAATSPVPAATVPKTVQIQEPVDRDAIDTNAPVNIGDQVSVSNTFDESSFVKKLPLTDLDTTVPEPTGQPPKKSINENVISSFVPAPPSELDPKFDDSRLGSTLPRGRLSIRCVEGLGVRRKDDPNKVPRTDPFIKFKLGAAERHTWKQTKVYRKQTDNPQFENEVVYFDILDPKLFVFRDDLQVIIEIWNKSTLKDELMGTVSMSVVRFLRTPFASYTERVPMYLPGAKQSSSKLALEFIFEEARCGMFCLTLYEAKGLRSVDPMGQQDPYVQFKLGEHYVKSSSTIKGGGTDPYFAEENVLLWADAENWVNDLQISLLDAALGVEKPIGTSQLCLLPYMNSRPDDAKEDSFDLFYTVFLDPKDDRERKEVSCGQLNMKVTYYPAGKLSITLDKAKNLMFPENYQPLSGDLSRMDPYVNLTLEGKAVKMVKRTPADKDGGSDPVWENEIEFDIVDQYIVTFEVFNQNIQGADVLLGTTELALLPVFRNGHTNFWTSLKQRKANGGIREVGDILIDMKFVGPIGVQYPQFRPEVDSYDDTVRVVVAPKQEVDDDAVVIKPPISTIPNEQEVVPRPPTSQQQQQVVEEDDIAPPEFSEEEIAAAFQFIDLDHNNFVGAKEIRHILVCMGEMITDEEIDMMIQMVDMDGDGQVSYQEFRTLVLHPDPSSVDMHKEVNAAKDVETMKEKQAMAGKVSGLDLKAFQRQKELTAREAKKKLLISFVSDNEVNFDYCKNSYQTYLMLPKEKRLGGRIKFGEFCAALNVEPISEYKHLHTLFDTEELGDMDFREFLLSMMNFIEVDREMRIRFSFTMFDELKTGFISQKEVEEILRGNHMISLASVQRKAETIMRQASTNSTGSITMNEFVVVSKKFPNILLPSIGSNPTAKHTA